MKKLLFISVLSLAAYACSNAPKMSESATKVAGIKTWVDSIKAIVDTSNNFDSTRLADWNAQFQDAIANINVEELDEASKTAFSAAQDAFKSVGSTYQMGIDKAKAAAATVTTATDSTASNVIEEVKEKVIEKSEKAAEKLEKSVK